MKDYYQVDFLTRDLFESLKGEDLVKFFLRQFSWRSSEYYDETGSPTKSLNELLRGFCLGARLCGAWSLEKAEDFTIEVRSHVRSLHYEAKSKGEQVPFEASA